MGRRSKAAAAGADGWPGLEGPAAGPAPPAGLWRPEWRRPGGWAGPAGRRAWREAGAGSGDEGEAAAEEAEALRRLRAKAQRAADREAAWEDAADLEPGDAEEGAEDEEAAEGYGRVTADEDEEADEEANEESDEPEEEPEPEDAGGRTVFVGNVPGGTKAKTLKREFGRYGAVESVRLRSVALAPGSKLPRRAAAMTAAVDPGKAANAYVVFKDAAAAEAALAANMTEFRGHHLRVDQAAAPYSSGKDRHAAGQYDPKRSVFVGNLDFDLQDEELIRFVQGAADIPQLQGRVEGVRIVKDKKINFSKGFGFVLFASKEAARAALLLDGRELNGRKVRVTKVERPGRPAAAKPDRQRDQAGQARRPSRERADWQGIRTKGAKGVRGAKPRRAAGKAAAGQPAPAPAKRTGKRPAVLKRKAAQLAAKGGAPGGGGPGKKAKGKKQGAKR